MKKYIFYLCISTLIFFSSCSDKKILESDSVEMTIETGLPLVPIDLTDMTAFRPVSKNWKIASGIYANKSKKHLLEITQQGSGVLVNIPNEDTKDNLYTKFEHGDIELELDVMMPKGSNSGLYLQSRYEVQLFDSWGVKEPTHADMGGIYQQWDEVRGKDKEGFEGYAPKLNAAKAPGLWQHFKIIFHAPKFDSGGKKIKNAWFEEVWLNGVLVQNNVEVTGPTRASEFEDEQPMGSLMIQGDHGPVAIKNIKYKLYGDAKVGFKNLVMKEYKSTSQFIPSLDSLEVLRDLKTDSISPVAIAGRNAQKIISYAGNLEIPKTGDYLFDMKTLGGALLLIDNDTLIDMDGNYNLDSLGIGAVRLNKGKVPFTVIYNKHTSWRRGFDLLVEGPGIQKYSLHAPIATVENQEPPVNIEIKVGDEPITQRSFLIHKGVKRTHTISVGNPARIHYSYDLEAGSLLQVWGGGFLDATQMWHARGQPQTSSPKSFTIAMHGNPEFVFLENDKSDWPKTQTVDSGHKSLGYEMDENESPIFLQKIKSTSIASKFVPSQGERVLKRIITVDGDQSIWHKIGEGSEIKKLPDGTFIINDESYFIDFEENGGLKPIIRSIAGREELLVEIPEGKKQIDYSIIW